MLLGSIRSYFKSSWETLSFRQCSWQDPLKNQRGQSIVEYILLVVVILTIAYGLGKHFFQPLQKFGASVFTSTIACALEYGQLPAEITAEEGCSASLQATAMTGGKGGAGGASSNGKGGSSSSNSGGKNSSDSATKASKSKNGDEGGGGSTSSSGSSDVGENGSSRGSGGSPTTIISRKGTLQLGKSPGAEANKSASNEIVYDSSGSDGDVNYAPGGSRGRRRKPIYKPVKGEFVDELWLRKKKEKIVDKGGGRSVASTGGEEGKPKKLIINTKRDLKKAETQEANWDMSKMLRMALIILMIIAILIFVLFQVSQIRKGAGSS